MSFLKTTLWLVACLLAVALSSQIEAAPAGKAKKPSPDRVLELLRQGNRRFVAGKSIHPHTGAARLALAGRADQADYALATIITCSDSRVPVELIFDAGVMDLFVIRVAGNVCNTDEIGSIEYGLAHVHTPLLVVLGHTQCGAVIAVARAIQGRGHALERNIPPLVAPIFPAVRRAMTRHPQLTGDAVVPAAIEENVWQGIFDLFLKSPAVRNLVKKGRVKVVGAIYEVGTGRVRWLSQAKVRAILSRAEASPHKAIEPMAGGPKRKKPAAGH